MRSTMKPSIRQHSKNGEEQLNKHKTPELKGTKEPEKPMSPTAINPDPNAKDGNGIVLRSAPLDPTNLSLEHSPGKSTEAFGAKDAFGAGHPSPDMPRQAKPTPERIPPSPSVLAKKTPHSGTVTTETAVAKKTPHSDTVVTEMAGTTKSAGTNPAGVPRQGNLSPQRHQSAPTAPVQPAPPLKTRTDTLSTPAQAMPHTNAETNLMSMPGSDNHDAANARAKMLKPRAPRGKRSASGSAGPKKRLQVQEDEVKATKLHGEYVVLEAKKSYNDKPAFMKGLADNLDRANEIHGDCFVGIFKRNSDEEWDYVGVALVEVQEGEDANAAIERTGMAFAEALEKYTEPFKRGKIVGLKTVRFAFINNEEPEYLNAVVGDNNAARIIAETYQDYIKDGTFWESADDVIATYFDESIGSERVKKMIQYACKKLID